MSSSGRPSRGMEFKAAATMLAPPGPAVTRTGEPASVVDDHGEIVALAAVTGVVDDVGDEIVPGAFRRSLRERTPRMCIAHDWGRVAGRATEVVELMPGDARLPRTTPRGEPWPPEAGALLVKATFLPTREGQEAREIARAFGPDHSFSIGFKAVRARQRGPVRELHDVDLFEFSPVLHGANRLATVLSVKGGRPAGLERKATPAGTGRRLGYRPGVPQVVACGTCGLPAAAVVPGGLQSTESLICATCVQTMTDALDEHVAEIDPAELDEAAELTSEQEYESARADEDGWELAGDGELEPAPRAGTAARRGAAWSRSTAAGWGTP